MRMCVCVYVLYVCVCVCVYMYVCVCVCVCMGGHPDCLQGLSVGVRVRKAGQQGVGEGSTEPAGVEVSLQVSMKHFSHFL